LLVVRSTGELEYWAPEGGFVDSGEWVRNGFVRTGKVIGGVAGEEGRVRKEEGDVRVRCSSAKKTVLGQYLSHHVLPFSLRVLK
jgi:hypothetical protein